MAYLIRRALGGVLIFLGGIVAGYLLTGNAVSASEIPPLLLLPTMYYLVGAGILGVGGALLAALPKMEC